MQRDTTASASLNTTAVTKTKEQVLILSSGAIIAVIVIGIILILTFLLIVLKTYNRRAHANRMMSGSSSRPRKKTSSTTINTNLAMSNMGGNSASGSFTQPNSNTPSESGFRIPRVNLSNMEQNSGEHFSTTSGSTIVTIHEAPSVDNT